LQLALQDYILGRTTSDRLWICRLVNTTGLSGVKVEMVLWSYELTFVIWLRLFIVMPVAVVGALMQFEITDQQDISMRPATVALPLKYSFKTWLHGRPDTMVMNHQISDHRMSAGGGGRQPVPQHGKLQETRTLKHARL
jgi:hypothetical protein